MGSVMDPVNIGILSLVWNKAIDSHLIQRFKTPKTELRFIQLKPTDLREFSPPSDLHAVILLHPFTEGRLSLTDVTDARYSTLIPILSSRFGSDGVCVIAYLLKGFKESTERTHLLMLSQSQPTVFQKSKCVILCGKLENMFQQNVEKIQEFIKLRWSNIRKIPWLEEWNLKPATLGDVGDKKIKNADNTCSKDKVDKDSGDDISHDGENETLAMEINSDDTDHDALSDPTNDICQQSEGISNDETPRMDDENQARGNEPTDKICPKPVEICSDKIHNMDLNTEVPIQERTVLVTDASGFIASHIVQQLTQSGYKVRGTLSSMDKPWEVGTLRGISPGIQLFEADICNYEALHEAIQGCNYVIHTSRFQYSKPAEQDDITQLLHVCQLNPGLKRVVITGLSDLISVSVLEEEEHKCKDWNTTNNALKDMICKYISEMAVYAFLGNQTEEEPTFGLSIIKPPVILGPILCNPAEANVEIVRRRMVDARPGRTDSNIPVCDVRDVAKAHVKALEQTKSFVTNPGVRPHYCSLYGMEDILKSEFEKQGYKFVSSPWPLTKLTSWKNRLLYNGEDESSCLERLYASELFYQQMDDKPLIRDVFPKKVSILDMAHCCIDRGFIEKKPDYRPREPVKKDKQITTDAPGVHRFDHDSNDYDHGYGDG